MEIKYTKLDFRDDCNRSTSAIDYCGGVEDCILTGQVSTSYRARQFLNRIFDETLDDHDLAWGGFQFIGRVHKNGLVVLVRVPVSTSSIFWMTSLIRRRKMKQRREWVAGYLKVTFATAKPLLAGVVRP